MYLKECFDTQWADLGCSVIKGFTNLLKTELPLVTVDLEDVDYGYVEIGSNEINKFYYFNINLFARNDGEKLDMVDFLYDMLKEGCPYVEAVYTDGTFKTISVANTGRVRIKIESSNNTSVTDATSSKDKYRFYIQISARPSQSGSSAMGLRATQVYNSLEGQTEYTTEHTISSIDYVTINGLTQVAGVDFTTTANIVTFTTPNILADVIYIAYYY
jgi:hypothetical protein